MPQVISSSIFGLSFVSEKHAANELGWFHSERCVANRRDSGTPSEAIKSDSCRADRHPPPPIEKASLITQSSWRQRCHMRYVLAATIIIAVGSLSENAKADLRWCEVLNQGVSNCSFTAIEECRSEVSGTGGFCMPAAPVGHRQPTRASVDAARKAIP
jgi:hypothetical protein